MLPIPGSLAEMSVSDVNHVTASEFYLTEGVAIAERVLGFGDREAESPSYGCFDRYYWHYKVIDFPNARAQEVGFYLALLYKHPFPGNRYAGVAAVRRWAEAAVSFWSRIQNPDGSFNEWFPLERSFCATSFSTLAAAQTVRLLNLSSDRHTFRKAADWLCKHDNPEVCNQAAASALALRYLSEIVDDHSLAAKAEDRIKALLKRQHDDDGFFPEYGGADIGYHSLTVSLLAAYQQESPSELIEGALRKAIEFLKRNIQEDGGFDYRTASRRTQFLYPSGFVRLKDSTLVSRHLSGYRAGTVLLPSWMDDRYCFQLATDYLVAGLLK